MAERTVKQRTLATLSLASAFGLGASFALPLVGDATTASLPVGGPSQALFSEVSIHDMPASLADIDAVASNDMAKMQFSFDPDAVVNFPFTSPVTLTDGFGYRTAPVAQFHDAQDFAATAGTPIKVIADGIVTEAGMANDGCGFALTVEHEIDGAEVTSRYCHMGEGSHDYEVGDEVRMGDPAGEVGNTGMSFGAHLHLALRVDDEPVDPLPFLTKYSRLTRADLERRSEERAEEEPRGGESTTRDERL